MVKNASRGKTDSEGGANGNSFEMDGVKSSKTSKTEEMQRAAVFGQAVGVGGSVLVTSMLFGSTVALCAAPLDCEKIVSGVSGVSGELLPGAVPGEVMAPPTIWAVRALRDELYDYRLDSEPLQCGDRAWVVVVFAGLVVAVVAGGLVPLWAAKKVATGRKRAALPAQKKQVRLPRRCSSRRSSIVIGELADCLPHCISSPC